MLYALLFGVVTLLAIDVLLDSAVRPITLGVGGVGWPDLPIAWQFYTSCHPLTLKTLKLLWLSKVEWTVLSLICVANFEYEAQLQQKVLRRLIL